MRYLILAEVVYPHDAVVEAAGGARGLRDAGALASALARPRATLDGVDLHRSIPEKAAALVRSHAFVDGNKRVAHAAIETFLVLNGLEILAPTDEQERIMLALAAGIFSREDLVHWLQANVEPCGE